MMHHSLLLSSFGLTLARERAVDLVRLDQVEDGDDRLLRDLGDELIEERLVEDGRMLLLLTQLALGPFLHNRRGGGAHADMGKAQSAGRTGGGPSNDAVGPKSHGSKKPRCAASGEMVHVRSSVGGDEASRWGQRGCIGLRSVGLMLLLARCSSSSFPSTSNDVPQLLPLLHLLVPPPSAAGVTSLGVVPVGGSLAVRCGCVWTDFLLSLALGRALGRQHLGGLRLLDLRRLRNEERGSESRTPTSAMAHAWSSWVAVVGRVACCGTEAARSGASGPPTRCLRTATHPPAARTSVRCAADHGAVSASCKLQSTVTTPSTTTSKQPAATRATLTRMETHGETRLRPNQNTDQTREHHIGADDAGSR